MTRVEAMAAVAALLCALVAGCASEDRAANGLIRRDSAGVEIVEQSAPLRDSLGWTVDPEPAVRIGARLRGPDDILFRVGGAARLSDGRIVVANGGTQEIRFYAADGRLERSAGGEGEGPGEFASVGAPVVGPADSVYVLDDRRRLIGVLSSRGDFVAQRRLPDRGSSALLETVLEDGAMVITPFDLVYEPSEIQVWRDSMQLLKVEGMDVEPMPFFRWFELYRSPGSFGRVRYTGDNRIVFHGNEVRETTGARGQLRFRTLDRQTLRLARWPVTGRAFDASAVLDAARAGGATEEEVRARAERMRERSYQYPDSVPAYDAHLVDAEGVSWLRRFRYPWEEDNDPGVQWDLISQDGRWLGQVELPGAFEPSAIGAVDLLGVFETELGVEEVRVYPLDRSATRE